MAKTYKGALTLDWYNKQKSILLVPIDGAGASNNGIPAPSIDWINKDQALFYELADEVGRGLRPYWVHRGDLRVREVRPLVFQYGFSAIEKDQPGSIPGTLTEFELEKQETEVNSSENMLIKGDNLLALNSLVKHFSHKSSTERIKCIVIDPPYNTGSAFEQYDDNLEHSEWLTLMRDRLMVLRELLSEDGSIWIAIDDKEAHYLKILCDDIFGKDNFVANVIWEKVYSPRMDATGFSVSHDHILVYSKSDQFVVKQIFLSQNSKQFSKFDSEKKKYYRPRTLRKEGSNSLRSDRPNLFYPLKAPDGTEVFPIRPDGQDGCWRWSNSTYEENLVAGNVDWIKKDNKWEVIVKQWKEENPSQPPTTYWDLKESLDDDDLKSMLWNWLHDNNRLEKLLKEFSNEVHDDIIMRSTEVGHNHEAKEEVKAFNKTDVFSTPKPERLISKILDIATNEGDYVLDCFAGSGTALAVAHKMNRKWIGIEVGKHAETHIVPRLNAVITGVDQGGISRKLNWLGSGAYSYYQLGQSIISHQEDGGGDFNWNLERRFIEESLLLSYDYQIEKEFRFESNQLFQFDPHEIVLGLQQIGTKRRVAVVSLNPPDQEKSMMSYEEISSLYNQIKIKYDPEYVNIFTNRGIEIAEDSKPENLEIIKVPTAIFAELEK